MLNLQARFIEPEWPAPASVMALSTVRSGGLSEPPFDSLNLGLHVGDDRDTVLSNRKLLADSLPPGHRIQWLEQVHGSTVVEAAGHDLEAFPRADASWSASANIACAVMTADCLPILFCSRDGRRVGATHAGWRGLAAGVIESTVRAMGVPAQELMAWLGPAIGPETFEVGPEVREVFLEAGCGSPRRSLERCFVASESEGCFLADLYQLARIRLQSSGVRDIYGGQYCTLSDPQRFFSFRRDGRTGRMASLVMVRPDYIPT